MNSIHSSRFVPISTGTDLESPLPIASSGCSGIRSASTHGCHGMIPSDRLRPTVASCARKISAADRRRSASGLSVPTRDRKNSATWVACS